MQHLKDLTNKAREALDKIDQNLEALEEFRVEYFGKKGILQR